MKLNWFTIFLILITFFSCENKSHPNPNIIIVLTDDQGWGDLSLHGNSNIRTPNLDQIANNGVRVIIAGLDMDYLGNPFGPMPNPKYAVSVVIENGESGGSVAGPVAIEVLNALLKK